MLARLFLLCLWLLSWLVFTSFLPFGLALPLGLLATWGWLLINLYPDKILLHFLQSRETIETDHPLAYRVARAQAYKFKIQAPRIYSYSGFFHRAFALAAGRRLVFVLEKQMLINAQESELESLFFSLSLQASQRVAARHTMALMLLSLVWAPALKVLSLRGYSPKTMNWGIQFLVAPLARLLYGMALPLSVWKKFLKTLEKYEFEESRLRELNAKFDQPRLQLGPTRLFSFRFYSSGHTPSQQMILAIEGASHPFDALAQLNMREAHA